MKDFPSREAVAQELWNRTKCHPGYPCDFDEAADYVHELLVDCALTCLFGNVLDESNEQK